MRSVMSITTITRVILKGPKGWANLNTKDTNVWEGDYQMVGRRGAAVKRT